MKIAHGTRDEHGKWHADNPEEYPPMDVHGQLPWSVLDQSAGHWRSRVAWWRKQGVDDITPRLHAPAMINTGRHGKNSHGVSRFDPFLTELLITWLCPKGGHIFDPCAGGPVRGIVATKPGRTYTGLDISQPQLDANHTVAENWGLTPEWDLKDGITPHEDSTADFVLTCPPYHNRERYSDDPRDLSSMKWAEFLDAHKLMLESATRALKQDRFLAWVISDTRDSKGHLRGLPGIVEQQMRDCGLGVTNQIILMEPGGLRVKTMRVPWEACRTTTRRHQIILIGVKGDRRKATKTIKESQKC